MDSPHVPIGDRGPLPHGHGSVSTPRQQRGGILALPISKGFRDTLYSGLSEASFSTELDHSGDNFNSSSSGWPQGRRTSSQGLARRILRLGGPSNIHRSMDKNALLSDLQLATCDLQPFVQFSGKCPPAVLPHSRKKLPATGDLCVTAWGRVVRLSPRNLGSFC